MLKEEIRFSEKRGINFICEDGDKVKHFKPWLGDAFSFLYDAIMKRSVFPRLFFADVDKHNQILKEALNDIRSEEVVELATGSGSAVNFLNNQNHYTGSDISPGLLRRAAKNLRHAGFEDAELYVAGADGLPFADSSFAVCLCILSLNFFSDIDAVLKEVRRVLASRGVFVCCVPVPERKSAKSKISGTLYSEDELSKICERHGLRFESIKERNGALLYFKAFKQ